MNANNATPESGLGAAESRHAAPTDPVSEFDAQRRVFDRMEGVAIQGYDRNRRVTYWNTGSERVYGYSRQEAIGRRLEALIIPEDMREQVIEDVRRWHDHGVPIPAGELTLVGKAGTPVYVHSSHVMLENHRGGKEMYCIDVDLTERKKIEDSLRESEAQKKALLDSSLDSIRLVDTEMRIVWTNKIIEKQVGGDREKVIGNYCHKVYTGRDRPCPNCPTLKAKKSGKTEHSIIIEENVKGIQGTTYWADYAVPIKDESGEIVRFLQVSRDITDLKKAEAEKEKVIEELRHALSTVKTLSGLLPICAACKRIRNDEGYWDMLESYIQKHSSATFSHSMCPACARKYYPDLDILDEK